MAGLVGVPMLVSVVFVFVVFTHGVNGEEYRCSGGSAYAYDLEDCNRFYACVGDIAYRMMCPAGTVFSLKQNGCLYRNDARAQECFILAKKGQVKSQNGHGDASMGKDDHSGVIRVDGDDHDKVHAEDHDMVVPGDDKTDHGHEGDGHHDDLNLIGRTVHQNDGDVSGKEQDHCGQSKGVIPHGNLCHRYYNCSNPHGENMNKYLSAHEYECPYPELFSLETMSCEDFHTVKCGDREEYMDPCEYAQNMCSGPNCKTCNLDHASCVGLPDGYNYWPGREGTSFWVQCRGQRSISQGDCALDNFLTVFSAQQQSCVQYIDAIKEICHWTSSRLVHPYECHMYFECRGAGTSSSSSDYDPSRPKICPYPQLFSVRSGQCENYNIVSCGSRREAKTPCDYMPSECEDSSFASCSGLPDGKNVFRTREGTPHYVVCQAERTVDKNMCPMDDKGVYKQFSPMTRDCMQV